MALKNLLKSGIKRLDRVVVTLKAGLGLLPEDTNDDSMEQSFS